MPSYADHGLPSDPKNQNEVTVPYAEAIRRIQAWEYGIAIKEEYDNGDYDINRRILFLVGRDFGGGKWSKQERNEKMLELVTKFHGEEHKRFLFLLSKVEDRNLLDQTIGAESDAELYTNTGEASGKTYMQVYGEQIATILR